MKKTKKKKKAILNNVFRLIAIVSTVMMGLFLFSLFLLDMIPVKYLVILFLIIGVIFIVLVGLSFGKKIKVGIRFFCSVVLILFSILAFLGIKYIDDTKDFVNVIMNDLLQKEEYYVMTLASSDYKKIGDLEGKIIGVYASNTDEKAIELLGDEIKVEIKEFSDITKMLEQLSLGNIEAVLVSSSVENFINTELSSMDLSLRKVHSILVPIEKVNIVKTVDVTNTSFNIYVAGGDSYGSIDKVSNTDVNMVVSVDPVEHKILLTSIPRDYYVNLPLQGSTAYDKLTHAGYYGIQESVAAVEKLLDININYYVKVNFSTIEGIIDAIGGIDVYSDYAFSEHSFWVYSYVKGYNHLNGEQALAFARERKTFVDGDIQRVKNQQKVLTAVIDKMTSSTALITNYSQILNSVSSSFSTNIDMDSVSLLIKMQLNDMPSWGIESQNLTGTDFSSTNTYTFPGTNLYVMKPDMDSVDLVKEKINEFLGNS